MIIESSAELLEQESSEDRLTEKGNVDYIL